MGAFATKLRLDSIFPLNGVAYAKVTWGHCVGEDSLTGFDEYEFDEPSERLRRWREREKNWFRVIPAAEVGSAVHMAKFRESGPESGLYLNPFFHGDKTEERELRTAQPPSSSPSRVQELPDSEFRLRVRVNDVVAVSYEKEEYPCGYLIGLVTSPWQESSEGSEDELEGSVRVEWYSPGKKNRDPLKKWTKDFVSGRQPLSDDIALSSIVPFEIKWRTTRDGGFGVNTGGWLTKESLKRLEDFVEADLELMREHALLTEQDARRRTKGSKKSKKSGKKKSSEKSEKISKKRKKDHSDAAGGAGALKRSRTGKTKKG